MADETLSNTEPQPEAKKQEVAETKKVVEVDPDPVPIPVPDATIQGEGWVVLLAVVLSFLVSKLGNIPNAHTVRRWLPLAYTGIWGLTIVGVTGMYSQGLSPTWRLVIWLLFLLVIFASVGWLRSVMSGIALALEGRIKEGDAVRISNVEGEVVSFGLRSVRLRAVDGTIHEIPNTKFVTDSVANISGDGGDSACEILLVIPESIEPSTAITIASDVAILTPLASPRHSPEVFLLPPEAPGQPYKVLVRGYAFDPTYQEHFRSDVVARFADLVR